MSSATIAQQELLVDRHGTMGMETSCFSVKQHGNVLVFIPHKGNLASLSSLGIAQVQHWVHEWVEHHPKGRLVVDLSGLDSADSILVAVLIGMRNQLETRDGRMVLACVPETIDVMLRNKKLDTLWQCYATSQEAVVAVQMP